MEIATNILAALATFGSITRLSDLQFRNDSIPASRLRNFFRFRLSTRYRCVQYSPFLKQWRITFAGTAWPASQYATRSRQWHAHQFKRLACYAILKQNNTRSEGVTNESGTIPLRQRFNIEKWKFMSFQERRKSNIYEPSYTGRVAQTVTHYSTTKLASLSRIT